MTVQAPSSLYSTHLSRPRKRPTVAVLMRAIKKVMKVELGTVAITRWHEQLDNEIGELVFSGAANAAAMPVTTTNHMAKVWCPVKPRLARLLVQAIVSKECLSDGKPVAILAPIAFGSTKGPLAKIINRRVVDLVITKHGDVLRACGELRADLFVENAEKQLAAAIARHATDVLTYVTARARELAHADEEVILEMQTVDQTLHGRETRGSGLVCCEKGTALVHEAADAILGAGEPGDATAATASSDDE